MITKFEKWINELYDGKKSIEAIISDKENNYYYIQGKRKLDIDKIAVIIWRNQELFYTFSLNNSDENRIILLIKNNRLLLSKGNNSVHSYGFENKENSEFDETVIIAYTFENDANIIVASNKSSQINQFVTIQNDNESTENFISNIITIKKAVTKKEISKEEGQIQ